MSYVALVIGATTTPPSPPIAAAATKLQNANVRSGIPNVEAIGGFATAARTAVPAYVCRKNAYSAPNTSRSVSSTHSACGGSAPPNSTIALPPENAGRLSGFVPHTKSARPRNATSSPSVMKISVTPVAARAGRIASR